VAENLRSLLHVTLVPSRDEVERVVEAKIKPLLASRQSWRGVPDTDRQGGMSRVFEELEQATEELVRGWGEAADTVCVPGLLSTRLDTSALITGLKERYAVSASCDSLVGCFYLGLERQHITLSFCNWSLKKWLTVSPSRGHRDGDDNDYFDFPCYKISWTGENS
jgi:hypothetical protein